MRSSENGNEQNIIKSLPLGIIYRKNCEGSLKNVLDVLSMIGDRLLINTNLDVDKVYSSSIQGIESAVGVAVKSTDGNTYISVKDGYAVSVGAAPNTEYSANMVGVQLGGNSSILSRQSTLGVIYININAKYFEDDHFEYISNGTASQLAITKTALIFNTAVAGSAGDTISWVLTWSAP